MLASLALMVAYLALMIASLALIVASFALIVASLALMVAIIGAHGRHHGALRRVLRAHRPFPDEKTFRKKPVLLPFHAPQAH